nr:MULTISPECIES: hypothetical protein [Providencia]
MNPKKNPTKTQKGIFIFLIALLVAHICITAKYSREFRSQPYTDFFDDLKYKFEHVKLSELQQYPSYGTLIITSNDKIWANQNSDLTKNVEVMFWYEKASLINGVRLISVVDPPFKSPNETTFSIPIPELIGYKLTHINLGELTIPFDRNSGRQFPFNQPNTIGTAYDYYTQKYSTEEEKKQNCWAGYDCLHHRLFTEMTIQIDLEGTKKLSSSDTFIMYDSSSSKGAAAYWPFSFEIKDYCPIRARIIRSLPLWV